MGELAEDIIDGLACSGCGVYFEKEHGYPVYCPNCWEAEDYTEKAIYPTL